MAAALKIDYNKLKEQIGAGQTKEVLDLLRKHLQTQEEYKDYLNEVILISSNYQTLERARRIDILHFQNYRTKSNQIIYSVLALIDDLEKGRSIKQKEQPKVLPFWKIATALLFLITFLLGVISIAIYYFHKEEVHVHTDTPTSIPLTWECPDFEEDVFNVLVLPFHDEKNAPTKPHKLIADQLDRFCKEENLAAQISRLQNDEQVKSVVTEAETTPYTEKCEPDMIVWGYTTLIDKVLNITTKYSIVNPFEFTQIATDNLTQVVDTELHAFGSPADYEKATFKIQEVLKTLLKVLIAYENKDYSTVVKKGKEIQDITKDEPNIVLSFIEAESHYKLGNKTEAIDAYSKVLDIDPTTTLALSNRAHLSLEQRELGTALADLTTLIDVAAKPDYATYQKRAIVNEELNDLGAAKADLIQAKKFCPTPQKTTIDQQINTIDTKIKLMNTTKPKGNGKETLNKNESLNDARNQNKMGNTKNAASRAKAMLKQNPKHEEAIEILVETKILEKPTITISELKKIPELKNINEKSLKKFKNPRFRTIIQNEKVARFKKKKKGVLP